MLRNVRSIVRKVIVYMVPTKSAANGVNYPKLIIRLFMVTIGVLAIHRLRKDNEPQWHGPVATIFFDRDMGMGNEMFQYASLMALSRHYNQQAALFGDRGQHYKIHDYFYLTIPKVHQRTPYPFNGYVPSFYRLTVDDCCKYPQALMNVESLMPARVFYGNYIQSYRLFQAYAHTLRKQFTFRSHILRDCQRTLDDIAALPNPLTGQACRSHVFVGVHVRRGDMLNDKQVKFGHVVASGDYLDRAIDHVNRLIKSEDPKAPIDADRCVRFVIATNDREWTRDRVVPNITSSAVLLPENTTAPHDMCVLAHCNYSIITVGTFGWWSAFLANGPTVYQAQYAKEGSDLFSQFVVKDFFLDNWVGL